MRKFGFVVFISNLVIYVLILVFAPMEDLPKWIDTLMGALISYIFITCLIGVFIGYRDRNKIRRIVGTVGNFLIILSIVLFISMADLE